MSQYPLYSNWALVEISIKRKLKLFFNGSSSHAGQFIVKNEFKNKKNNLCSSATDNIKFLGKIIENILEI